MSKLYQVSGCLAKISVSPLHTTITQKKKTRFSLFIFIIPYTNQQQWSFSATLKWILYMYSDSVCCKIMLCMLHIFFFFLHNLCNYLTQGLIHYKGSGVKAKPLSGGGGSDPELTACLRSAPCEERRLSGEVSLQCLKLSVRCSKKKRDRDQLGGVK